MSPDTGAKPALYRVESVALLPFRDTVAEGIAQFTFGSPDDATQAAVFYQDQFPLGVPGPVFQTRNCTGILMSWPMKFSGGEDEFKKWLADNATSVTVEELLPRINHLLACIQFGEPNDVGRRTTGLRNVGEMDLLFHNISFNGHVVLARTTFSLTAALLDVEPIKLPDSLPSSLPSEWLLLTRAVHLVNHGFLTEAVLVSFALLDVTVQQFLVSRFPHLSHDEGGELVGAVESRRLRRYFGLMMRMAVAASPLDDPETDAGLKWLNKLRNSLMHRADACSMVEAQRAIRIVHGLLAFLNDHGAGLALPNELKFWTPIDEIAPDAN